MKLVQITIFCALIWAFMPVIKDLTLCLGRFFFRLADLINLIPDIL